MNPDYNIPLFAREDEEKDGSKEEGLPSPPSGELEATRNGNEGEKSPPKVLTAHELHMLLEEKLTTKKESVSALISQLMENPEGNVCLQIDTLYIAWAFNFTVHADWPAKASA